MRQLRAVHLASGTGWLIQNWPRMFHGSAEIGSGDGAVVMVTVGPAQVCRGARFVGMHLCSQVDRTRTTTTHLTSRRLFPQIASRTLPCLILWSKLTG